MKKSLKDIKLPKNNLSRFTMMFGLLGTLCLIISHFIPCLSVGGISKFFINEQFYLVVLAGISIVAVFIGDLIIPTGTSAISLWYFIDYTKRINTVYKQYALTTPIAYGIGFYLLLIGTALIITYVVFGLREKLKKRAAMKPVKKKEPLKNTTVNEEKPIEFTKSPLLSATSTTKKEEEVPVQNTLENANFLQAIGGKQEEQKKQEPETSIWTSPLELPKEPMNTTKSEPVQEATNTIKESAQSPMNTTQNKPVPPMANTTRNTTFMPTTEALKRREENPKEYHFPEMPVKEPAPFEPTTNSMIQRGEAVNPKEEQSPKEEAPKTATFTSFYDFELSPEELQRNSKKKEQ